MPFTTKELTAIAGLLADASKTPEFQSTWIFPSYWTSSAREHFVKQFLAINNAYQMYKPDNLELTKKDAAEVFIRRQAENKISYRIVVQPEDLTKKWLKYYLSPQAIFSLEKVLEDKESCVIEFEVTGFGVAANVVDTLETIEQWS